MKAATIAIFSASAMVTAGLWLALSMRDRGGENTAPPLPVPVPPLAEDTKTESAILDALFTAESAGDKVKSSEDLRLIPVQAVPAILDRLVAEHGRELTFPLRALLLRWAAADGNAAMNWAWLTYREDSDWQTARVDIARAWAWKDPEALGKWVLGCKALMPNSYDSLSLEKARAADTPPLEAIHLPSIMKWISPRTPELAVQILIQREGHSAEDFKLWDGFTDSLQFERAAGAFDPGLKAIIADERQTHHLSFGPHQHLRSLLLRWKEFDPQGFARSSFADLFPPEIASDSSPEIAGVPPGERGKPLHVMVQDWSSSDPAACAAWIPTLDATLLGSAAESFSGNRASAHLGDTLDWIGGLPSGVQEKSLVHAFDAWTAAHPGETADVSGAPGPLQSRWRDLETLKDTVGVVATP